MRGLVTCYTVFMIDLHSRRVQGLGSTPNPDEAFVVQTMRRLTDDVEGVLRGDRLLICDRDRKWSAAVERFLATSGGRVIRTPLLAPNCNAYAERFVRSIREECLNRVIPLGERHLRRMLAEFVAHDHGERNHQRLDNELIDRRPRHTVGGPVHRRERIGGLLSYYYCAARIAGRAVLVHYGRFARDVGVALLIAGLVCGHFVGSAQHARGSDCAEDPASPVIARQVCG
jgi:putative transposase